MAEVFDFGLQQHKIKMDGKFFENNLFAVAGDTGRRLEVQLLDSDNLVQNTTGISLRLNANVAGQATYAEATLVDATKGLYRLDLPNGMLMSPGNWQFQWQLIGTNGVKLHSFAFTGSIGSNLSEGGSEGANFYLNLGDLKKMQDDIKIMQEDLVNGTFNSEVLETNIAEKLNNLETQYAPKLTEVTAQLSQTAINIKSFGALGKGNNDTQSIKNAVAFCKQYGFGKLLLPKDIYSIDESIIVDFDNLEVDLNGSEIRWTNETKETGNYKNGERHFGFFTLKGSSDESTAQSMTTLEKVLSTRKEEHFKIGVANSSYYVVGDYVLIEKPIVGNLSKTYNVGFSIITKVIKISTGYVEVDYCSPYDFSNETISNYKIKKINPVKNVHIHNGHLNDVVSWVSPTVASNGPNLTKVVSGIGMNYAVSCSAKNITGKHNKFPLIMAQYCYDIQAENIEESHPNYTGSGQGYSVHYCGVMNGRVSNVAGHEVRHVVDFSYSAFCRLDNVMPSTSFNGAFDLHGIWEHDVIVDNMNGSIQLGNGNSNFPMMISGVTVLNSKIQEFVADGFIENLKFDNSSIVLGYAPQGNEITFQNSTIYVSSTRVMKPTYLSEGLINVLRFQNSKVISLTGGTQALNIFGYDHVSFDSNSEIGNFKGNVQLLVNDVRKLDCPAIFKNGNVRIFTSDVAYNIPVFNLSNSRYLMDYNYDVYNEPNKKIINADSITREAVILVNDIVYENISYQSSFDIFDFSSVTTKLTVDVKNSTFINKTSALVRLNAQDSIGSVSYALYKNNLIGVLDNSNTPREVASRIDGMSNQWLNFARASFTETDATLGVHINIAELETRYVPRYATLILKMKKTIDSYSGIFHLAENKTLNETNIACRVQTISGKTTMDLYVKAENNYERYRFYNIQLQKTGKSLFEVIPYNPWVSQIPTGGTIIYPTVG